MFKKLLLTSMIIVGLVYPTTGYTQDSRVGGIVELQPGDTMVVDGKMEVISVPNPMPKKVAFGGFRWDDGAIGSYGTGIEMPFFKNVWVFTYADFGDDQSGNVEVAYLRNVRDVFNDIPFLSKFPIVSQIMNHTIFDKIIAGPIMGPDFDITGGDMMEEGIKTDHVTYTRYAIGLMGVYKIFDRSGAVGYVKKKLSLDNGSNAGTNWVAGGALFVTF